MDMKLSQLEARIIGCLLEKESTTPDQYPLTLNALTTACNQKSNRDPVMSLSDAEVLDATQALITSRLVTDESAFGSRVSKFQHRFCNTEFGNLKLTKQEVAVTCVLLLRGPQTPGEIRTRTNRLCSFTDVSEVESVLQGMAEREDGGLVVRLPREPGKRESRFAHLFSGEVDVSSPAVALSSESVTHADNARLEKLEQEVSDLKEEVKSLKALLEELTS
ncbi:DUF480 domain-containing protein [Vibrio sp. Of7-15]|uniref:YceH family protein n=1 Tax=Vibrio sp. Of7-15 TaxID=2724879 RepID=UPI001EF1A464|nr:DUF480 domain-containing protein [Vibrio sp. Of7-15]MCG7495683.1 DUF480 domain-containing protein [Vibrio sp. Of7-15]